MRRRKSEQQPELGPPGQVAPELVEYSVGGERWRCGNFRGLSEEFFAEGNEGNQATPRMLELFHVVTSVRARSWLIVRRLFGIQPVVTPRDYPVEDLRVWGRSELAEALGLSRAQLQSELDAVRGAWKGVDKTVETVSGAAGATDTHLKVGVNERPVLGQQVFGDGEGTLLERHGFDLPFGNQKERAWFAGRVKDWEKVLREKFAAVLARNALMSELRIYQLDAHLNDPERCKPGSSEWKAGLKLREDLDRNYQDQVAQVKELCPWAGAIAGKTAFTGVLSDVTAAVQEYARDGSTRLVDGIFTATEIAVECRQSVQSPAPRYRAGLVVYLNAAKAGLFDPQWKPPFESGTLKRLDEAWKAAWMASGEASGEAPVDLEADGEKGEYAPLSKQESE